MLETVNNCTARCVMCGIEEWRKVMKADYMDDDLFYKIADEIIVHKSVVQKVGLFVGNEPLLDKKLAQRIKYFKDNGIKVNFSTNGSLMTKEKAIEILESGVDHVNFSMDSLDKQIYEKIRKPLKFEDVLGNIIAFISLRNSLNYDTVIRISFVKNALNQEDDINKISLFWRKILNGSRGDSIRVDELCEVFGDNNKRKEIIKYDIGDFLESANKKPCYTLWNTITIKTDGSIALCCVDQCRNIKLGNLKEVTIKENWENMVLREEIQEKHLYGGRKSVDICKNCIAWL